MKYIFSSLFLFFLSASFSTSLHPTSLNTYKIFEADGKVGMTDDQGNVLIPAAYDDIGWSKGELSPVSNTIGYRIGSSWGLISLKNERITSAEYSQLYHSGGGVIVAAKKGKITKHDFLGLISSQGKQVLPFKYTSIDVSGLRAIVSNRAGRQYVYGVVDFGDKTIIPIKYKDVKPLGSLRFAVKNSLNKIAIYSDQGSKMMDFSLDSISKFDQGFARIFKDHQQGMIDVTGKVVAEPVYQSVKVNNRQVEVKEFNEWMALSLNSVKAKSWSYNELEPYGENLYLTESNQKTWIVDREGNALSSTLNDYIGSIIKGKSSFKRQNKWGVLRANGSVMMEANFDSLIIDGDMIYGMVKRSDGPKWSLYDTFSIKKSIYEYDVIRTKTKNFYPVQRQGYWGFIDRTGEEVIHCVYDEVGKFYGNHVMVKFHDQYGIIDKYGEWQLLPQLHPLQMINEDLYLEKSSEITKLKSIDQGTVYFTENLLEVKEGYLLEHLSDGSLWKIDYRGRIVNENNNRGKSRSNEKYQEILPPSEGLYGVKINGAYGFIDSRNRLRISNRYESIGAFSEGFAAIKLRNKWGFIDKSEKLIVQPNYDKKSVFVDGLAIVVQNRLYGIIDKKGQTLISPQYDLIERLQNGRFLISKNNLYGLLDKSGKLIVNVKYEALEDLNNDQIVVRKFDQYGVVDLFGVDIIPVIYDELKFDPRFNEYLVMKKSKWKKAGIR